MSAWGRGPPKVTQSDSASPAGRQAAAIASNAPSTSLASLTQHVSALSKLRQLQRPQSSTASSPLASPQIQETVHPLRTTWCLWWLHRSPGSRIKDYDAVTKRVGAFSSVEDFFAIYTHLKRIDELPVISDYHLFRAGVKPTYEDPMNAGGGKWQIRLKKGLSARIWEDLVFALVGDQFFELGDEEICGAVMSSRASEDVLSVWNRSASNGSLNLKIRNLIRKALDLEQDVHMEYVSHETRTAQSQQQHQNQHHNGHHHHQHHHGSHGNHGHNDKSHSSDQFFGFPSNGQGHANHGQSESASHATRRHDSTTTGPSTYRAFAAEGSDPPQHGKGLRGSDRYGGSGNYGYNQRGSHRGERRDRTSGQH
ncbi:hypothetical protein PYCC9005_001630 [Savitreella phatthalungensis]